MAVIFSCCPSCCALLPMPQKMVLLVFTTKKENQRAGKNVSMLDLRIRSSTPPTKQKERKDINDVNHAFNIEDGIMAAIFSCCPSCYALLPMPQKMALLVFTAKKENHRAGKNLSTRKRGQKVSMLDLRRSITTTKLN